MFKLAVLLCLLPLAFNVGAKGGFSCSRSQQLNASDRTLCEVYQYEGVDSTSKELVLVRTYNATGRVVEEKYTNYREKPEFGKMRGQRQFSYRDTVLVEQLFTDEKGDQLKMRYLHDAAMRLTQTEQFTYERRLKPEVDKGFGRPGGCIIDDSDYQKGRTWEKSSVIMYTYDAMGRRVGYDAPTLHFSNQNRYSWAYDSLGRLHKHSSYHDQQLLWTEDYTYIPGGYRYTRTWYNPADGSPAHLKPQNQRYWPLYTFHYFLDSTGSVKREETTDERGHVLDRRLLYYNAQHQLVRDVYQNGKAEAELTHVYVYK